MSNYKSGHNKGNRQSSTYTSWVEMRRRCTADTRWSRRGITYDPSWNSFSVFLSDMGIRPPKTTLDRKDNDGPYNKANCRWADSKTQVRNSRTAKLKLSDVRSIRAMKASTGITNKKLAAQFEVTETNISAIIRGESWQEGETLLRDIRGTELAVGDDIAVAVPHGRNAGASLVLGTIKGLTAARVRFYGADYTGNYFYERSVSPTKVIKLTPVKGGGKRKDTDSSTTDRRDDLSARHFQTSDGTPLRVVTADRFRDAPDEIKKMFTPKEIEGQSRPNADADKLRETVLNHFKDDEVVSAEAIAVALHKQHGVIWTKERLYKILGYLTDRAFLIREARGYFRLAPEGYVAPPRVKAVRAPRKPKAAAHESKAERQAKLGKAHAAA